MEIPKYGHSEQMVGFSIFENLGSNQISGNQVL